MMPLLFLSDLFRSKMSHCLLIISAKYRSHIKSLTYLSLVKGAPDLFPEDIEYTLCILAICPTYILLQPSLNLLLKVYHPPSLAQNATDVAWSLCHCSDIKTYLKQMKCYYCVLGGGGGLCYQGAGGDEIVSSGPWTALHETFSLLSITHTGSSRHHSSYLVILLMNENPCLKC